MDVLIGLTTVLTTSLIYHKYKTKKASIISLILMVFVWLITAVISNWLFILPFYINLYGFQTVFGMLQIIPGITEANYMGIYLLVAVVPFNLILASSVGIITFFLYKRISKIYHASAYKNTKEKNN